MKEQILSLLKEIEQVHHIKILFACEAGSRAWGLENESSDYDLRFIYIHPLDQYLSIEEAKLVIEGKAEDNVEYTGWDLKKSLQLLKKQNPSIIEWLHSSTIYKNRMGFREELLHINELYFNEKPLLHHYFNMAKSNIKLLEKKPTPKLLLHVIRPVLLCEWIKDNKSFPTVNMEIITSIIKDDQVTNSIGKIIKMKKNEVTHLKEIEPILQDWIDCHLQNTKQYIDLLNEKMNLHKVNDEYNSFFRKVIKRQVWEESE